MLQLKDEKIAIPVVLTAGLLWSFGPLVVRFMDQPNLVPWQYLFARGITIFIILNLYLFFEEGISFYKNYFKIGFSGVIGGVGLGLAMICFIWSITNTSVAITLLCLAAMPFMTALLGFLFLKETISINIVNQTFNEIVSFKNKKPSKAVIKGMAAKQSKVIATLVFVIDQIKQIIARPSPTPPITPEKPILK
jgi:hypothetical protein